MKERGTKEAYFDGELSTVTFYEKNGTEHKYSLCLSIGTKLK